MSDIRGRRAGFFLIIAALAMMALALPVLATPDPDDTGHQVTICHVTESAGNPYVVITVDTAAFDGDGASDHMHHMAKDGRRDIMYDAIVGCPDDSGPGGGG